MPCELRHVHALSGYFAEDVEVRDTARARTIEHRRNEGLPELGIHMPRGIDPEAVDAVTLDPVAVDVDEPLHHARILGHQIVEAEKVTVQRVLAGEIGIAAVVIVDGRIQPGRHLHVRLGGRHEWRVGIVGVGEFGEVGGATNTVAGKLRIDRRPCEAALARVRIVALIAVRAGLPQTLAVLDHVRGVIGDDVEVHLHAARMRRFDKGVHVREVLDPVTVVAGGLVS